MSLTWVVLLCAASLAAGQSAGNDVSKTTSVERYPWIVQVETLGLFSGTWSQSCAGNILTSRWILSAANCFSGRLYSADKRRIRAGANRRNSGGVIKSVSRVINHPDYIKSDGNEGDVSVVEIRDPLTWTSVIKAATIVTDGFTVPDNLPLVYVGWGSLGSSGGQNAPLQHHTLPTVNNQQCIEHYAKRGWIVTPKMVCVGKLNQGGNDSCQSNSGGPLYYDDMVVGLISWGVGCDNGFSPGVAVSVGAYTNWIISTVRDN